MVVVDAVYWDAEGRVFSTLVALCVLPDYSWQRNSEDGKFFYNLFCDDRCEYRGRMWTYSAKLSFFAASVLQLFTD